jgi:sugar phosphate permease
MRNFFPFMATNPELTGIRADFIYANYIIACMLPLFVIFLCIRMVSNTKKAGAFTVLLTGLFVLFHWEEMQPAFISIVKSIAVSPLAIFGVVLGCTGVVGLLKGLYDEEQSEEYVHKRQYWNGIIAIMYLGIVLVCHGSGG